MPKLKTAIPTDDWNIIVEKIHQRKCVPFLGAGVNLKCGNEDSLPLGGDVALRLLERMIKRKEEISDGSYRINWKNLKQYREDARVAITAIHTELARKDEHPELEALKKKMDEVGVTGEAEQNAIVTLSSLAAEGKIPLEEKVIETLLKSVLQILPDEEAKLAHIIVDESLDQFQDLTRVALQDLARVSLRYRRNKNLPDFEHLNRALQTGIDGTLYASLAEAYVKKNENLKAISFYERARQVFNEKGDAPGEARVLIEMSRVYRTESKYDEVISSLEKAIVISRATNNYHQEGPALSSLGDAYEAKGDIKLAIEAYDRADRLYIEKKAPNYYRVTPITRLSELYTKNGDLKTAEQYKQLAEKLKTSGP